MKNSILTVIIFSFAGLCKAQELHFSQFFNSLYYTNPSALFYQPNPQVGFTYRNQWPGLKSAFVTYGIFYHHPLNSLNSSFGFTLLHDIQGNGAIIKTMPGGIYTYKIKISDQVNLGAGLALSYTFKGVNRDKLQFESNLTNGDGYTYLEGEKLRTGYFDFSLGLSSSVNEVFFAGMAVNHITTPNESFANKETGKVKYLFSIYSAGLIYLDESYSRKIALKPGVQFMTHGANNELLYGASLNVSDFEFGLWARNDINFNFDAIILSLGYSLKEYNFWYSYDVNLKSIKFFSAGMGAHEVTFSYNFKYKEKRKISNNKYRKW